jgi:hypothetical protein
LVCTWIVRVAGGACRVAHDEPEVVDRDRGSGAGQRCGGIERNLDVPRVERVLVEAQADELGEAQCHRSHLELERILVTGSADDVLEEFDQCAIGGQAVVSLGAR